MLNLIQHLINKYLHKMDKKYVKQINNYLWEISPEYKRGMRVPARIYASNKLFDKMDDGVFEQVTNVATLPGIQKYAFCMPDGHWGYGFPIGGVAAFDLDEGIISPGGIGFDINCGVRLVKTNLDIKEVQPKIKEVIESLFGLVPSGVGSTGFIKLSRQEFKEVMKKGVRWCLEKGLADQNDLERIEEYGSMPGANPDKVSDKAIKRGIDQLGTLGSGNHYLEIQAVSRIFNPSVAKVFGIKKEGQITIMDHCGSRGFGHQIGTDYLRLFDQIMPKYGIKVLDRELACAPFKSPEGQAYFGAMVCAANTAFVNRQVITHRIREGFQKIFKKNWQDLGMNIVYDVAHNIAKLEEHSIDGKIKKILIHRKGATRSFGPGQKELPEIYRGTGQPVIVGGSMETHSYLLVGTKEAMEETFGSTCHGSGRTMSRAQAKKRVHGRSLQQEMEKKGIIVRTYSYAGLAEEAGLAYKDISEVVETVDRAGISRKVCELRPLANIKG